MNIPRNAVLSYRKNLRRRAMVLGKFSFDTGGQANRAMNDPITQLAEVEPLHAIVIWSANMTQDAHDMLT